MPHTSKVAIVTGANRGIGLEVARQLAQHNIHVIIGARNASSGEEAAQTLSKENFSASSHQLDVTDQASIDQFANYVNKTFGRLNILINNAGILYDTWQKPSTADLNVVTEALNTNLFGPWRMAEAFLPLLRQSPSPRLVNVSSEAGSLAHMGPETPAYSTSKAALNALTRLLATDPANKNILINSICPGWTSTEMGGTGGRPISEGAASVAWAALLPDDGPTGGFFRDGKPLPW